MGLKGAFIQEIPGKGRGLIADRNLAPGDLILEEEPYAAVLFPAHKEKLALIQIFIHTGFSNAKHVE